MIIYFCRVLHVRARSCLFVNEAALSIFDASPAMCACVVRFLYVTALFLAQLEEYVFSRPITPRDIVVNSLSLILYSDVNTDVCAACQLVKQSRGIKQTTVGSCFLGSRTEISHYFQVQGF